MEDKKQKLPRLKLIAVNGGVWPVPPAAEQPVALTESWRVLELDNGDRRLVGWVLATARLTLA